MFRRARVMSIAGVCAAVAACGSPPATSNGGGGQASSSASPSATASAHAAFADSCLVGSWRLVKDSLDGVVVGSMLTVSPDGSEALDYGPSPGADNAALGTHLKVNGVFRLMITSAADGRMTTTAVSDDLMETTIGGKQVQFNEPSFGGIRAGGYACTATTLTWKFPDGGSGDSFQRT